MQQEIKEVFEYLSSLIPPTYKTPILFSLYTVLILFYSVFIWKFYKFMARRDILQLDLKKYNRSEHPVLQKILGVFLYILEYLIVLPFLVIFWFAIFSVFMLILAETSDLSHIIIMSVAIIVSTRIASYIGEDLSRDLAKIFPFTLLALFVLNPSFFNTAEITSRFFEIPSMYSQIFSAAIFIFVVEFFIRLIYSILLFYVSVKEDGNSTLDTRVKE